eukprot:gene24751-biopygen1402
MGWAPCYTAPKPIRQEATNLAPIRNLLRHNLHRSRFGGWPPGQTHGVWGRNPTLRPPNYILRLRHNLSAGGFILKFR